MRFEEPVGLLKLGTIERIDQSSGTMDVKLDLSVSAANYTSAIPKTIQIPYSLTSINGIFAGGLPNRGTPVVIGQGSGNQHYFVSYLNNNQISIPTLSDGEYVIQGNEDTYFKLNTSNEIELGSPTHSLKINTSNNNSFINSYFANNYSFTKGTQHINGVIKRDLNLNDNYSQDSKINNSTIYEENFITIGLDPTVLANNVILKDTKNPAFIENRKLIFEFDQDSDVTNELYESSLYSKNRLPKQEYLYPDRKISKSDVLSLSLNEPNYLIEHIEGTVVDIFGNILDINRQPLPIGDDDSTIRSSNNTSSDKVKNYLKIRQLQRKSIAYHFELNARKDLQGLSGKTALPDINSNKDYARARSRFFFDIDKEGQFKINVPSSSEKGNIPLLTRYENYSSFGEEDDGNPNKLVYRDDDVDIFIDSFAAKPSGVRSFTASDIIPGVISLKENGKEAGPLDRLSNKNIRHGTAYHDLVATCYSLQSTNHLIYQTDEQELFPLSSIPKMPVPISTTINIDGKTANAGGRSGQVNLDGSMELNVGANTSDRQSVVFDYAGGVIGNIGRDKNNNSYVVSMDGNLMLQVGGYGISNDSRFSNLNNGFIGGVIDLRVYTSGFMSHLIRIDDNGLSIMTPSQFKVYSTGNMILKSDAMMKLDAESMYIQGRLVNKEEGGSI